MAKKLNKKQNKINLNQFNNKFNVMVEKTKKINFKNRKENIFKIINVILL